MKGNHMSSTKWLFALPALALLLPGTASAVPFAPVKSMDQTIVVAASDEESPDQGVDKTKKKKGKKGKKRQEEKDREGDY